MLMVPDKIIADWQPHHKDLFGVHVIKLQHRLKDTGLFTREALGKVIERCPAKQLGIESVSFEGEQHRRVYGELGNTSGIDAIAAIEKGRIWMNIRRVMEWAPEYRDLLDKIFIPFFTTKQKGSGIGLALARQIILLHNGDITVH